MTEETKEPIIIADGGNAAPSTEEKQPSKKEILIGSIINVATTACDGVGNQIDANDCRVIVGVNLIANAFNGMSDASKETVLNQVVSTLVQASGLDFKKQEETPVTADDSDK